MGHTDRNRDAECYGYVLGRIVALLVALADLADCASTLPASRRRYVLDVLSRIETVVRTYIKGMAPDAAAWSDPPDFVDTGSGSCCDPARLAAGLRVLALVLWTMLAQDGRRSSEGAVALRAVEAAVPVWLWLLAGPAVFDSS